VAGRLLVVANDVTKGAGAFGLQGGMSFRAMAQRACESGTPLVYLAAILGPVGVAEEVKKKIRAAWVDDEHPEKGFQYLYLTPGEYEALKGSVVAHEVEVGAGGKAEKTRVEGSAVAHVIGAGKT